MSLRQLVVPNVKKWLRIDDDEEKPTGMRGVYSYLRNLYHHHQRERFLNFIEFHFKTAFGSWKPMHIPENVIHRVFYVSLEKSANGNEVIKIPIGNNSSSFGVIRSIRGSEDFQKYRRTLYDIKLDPWLKNHCVTVTHVRRDGGYASEYVQGINVAHLRDQILQGQTIPKPLREGLKEAIEQLVRDLTAYVKEHGKLVGDWPLHNLVFSLERRSIVNVDAEGFYTDFGTIEQAHLPLISANLMDLARLVELVDSPAPDDARIVDVLKMLDEVRRGDKAYNGRYFLTGYHSLELAGSKFRGQRECQERLAQVPFDFQKKAVIDLGCNCGGMLHALSKTIRRGCGIDFNPKCVNAANVVKRLNQSANLDFYTFDLDRDNLCLIKSFLVGESADICLLLSVCMWLRRWRDVVQTASTLAPTLLFESNGTAEQQKDQVDLLNHLYKKVQLLADNSPDDYIQGDRKLYLCSHA